MAACHLAPTLGTENGAGDHAIVLQPILQELLGVRGIRGQVAETVCVILVNCVNTEDVICAQWADTFSGLSEPSWSLNCLFEQFGEFCELLQVCARIGAVVAPS